jgi:hypothetical protein
MESSHAVITHTQIWLPLPLLLLLLPPPPPPPPPPQTPQTFSYLLSTDLRLIRL